MRKNSNQLSPSPRMAPPMQAVLWAAAIGAPSWFLYNNGVQAARRDAEEQVLSQVAQQIQSPSADRGAVFSILSQHEDEVRQARLLRACSRLGVKTNGRTDWNMLFANVLRRGQAAQEKAARVIAEVCGLSPDTTLKRERILMTIKFVAATEVQALPDTAQEPRLAAQPFAPGPNAMQPRTMPD